MRVSIRIDTSAAPVQPAAIRQVELMPASHPYRLSRLIAAQHTALLGRDRLIAL
jgi:hypothetical protein